MTSPNAMVASALFKSLLRIAQAGGVPGCDAAKAAALKPFATQHLLRIGIPASDKVKATGKAPSYQGTCRHLGKQLGEQPCATCQGSVVQKVFACHHPSHDKTTIRFCRGCRDYEPGAGRHTVEHWALGMTTAPRRGGTLRKSIRSLRRAGWKELLYVFAESGTGVWWPGRGIGPISLVRRQPAALGAWSNFFVALTELVLRKPDADAYLMVQDDVVFCDGLREYLEKQLWPGPVPGVVSLHTPRHLAAENGTGFFQADLGWNAWGAQAFVFSNSAARAFLADVNVVDHRLKGPLGGTKNVDSVVGAWCRRANREFWLHAPSLCEHTGATSTLWPGTKLEGRRRSADFPGEGVPLADALARHSGANGNSAPSHVAMRPDGTLAKWRGSMLASTSSAPHRIPLSFEEFWSGLTLDVLSISMGRLHAFSQWADWICNAAIPPNTSLVLVDNTREDAVRERDILCDFVRDQARTSRFGCVTRVRGHGPSDLDRTSDERVRNCAIHYGLGLARVAAQFTLVLDDDIIPPLDGLRHLVAGWHSLALADRKPAIVSGCCESARAPGLLVASRDKKTWRNQPKVGELGPGDLQELGFVGLGCALIHVPALRKAGRFNLAAIHGGAGPDAWLSGELRKHGHTIWLHGSVECRHLHRERG